MSSTTVVDENVPVETTSPLWSETRWNGCWSPASGAGLFLHAGRLRKDRDIWWVHFAAYLPGDRLAVGRLWTRNQARAGVRSDSLDLEMTPTGWRSRYDGVADMTTSDALGHRADRRTAPSARITWDVVATPVTPTWDIYANGSESQTFATSTHIQQAFATTGALSVDGETHTLDGIGFKDHSSGVRSHESWEGHRFLLGVMPGYSIHAITVLRRDQPAGRPFGIVFVGDERYPVEHFEAQPLQSVVGGPTHAEVVVTGRTGLVTLRLEIAHTFVQTVSTSDTHYDHFNGVDWDIPGDPMVMAESIVRVTDPDGAVGWAHFERSTRRSALTRPLSHTGTTHGE